MCKTGSMASLSHFFKKMAKMQSPHIQCCLCGFSVFSALFGMFMLSAGVCLVLNYNFLDVDTSGLPDNLNKEEAKKVVGIILICVGICSMGLGGLVSTLYFTACADRQVCKSASSSSSSSSAAAAGGGGGQEKGRDVEQGAKAGRPSSNGGHGHGHHRHHHHHGHHHSNGGVTPGRTSPALSRRSGGGSLTNLRKASDPRGRVSGGGGGGSGGLPPVALGKDGPVFSRSGGGGANGRTHTPPGSARSHGLKIRAGKKGRHGQGRYKNKLTPHPEEAGAESQSLTTATTTAATTTTTPTSSSGRTVFTDQGGYVNRGAQLSDDLNQARGSLASSSSGASSASPSVIIKVDSSHADCDDSPSHGPARGGEAAADFRQRSEGVAEYRVRGHGDVNDNRDGDDDGRYGDDEEEDESGRMSRSTVDSSDTVDGLDDASRLDSQMKQLIL